MPVYEDKKLKKNKWYFEINVGKDASGKRRPPVKKRGFATKKEAEKAMNEVLYKINKNTYVKPSDVLYGDYLVERWLPYKNVGRLTKALYESHTRLHIVPALGRIKISELKLMQIQDFLHHLAQDTEHRKGLSQSTVKRMFNMINNSLKSAVQSSIIEKNVMDDWELDKPKVSKRKGTVWDENQTKYFLEHAKGLSRHFLAFHLPLYTGLRLGEVLGLRWCDIDFKAKRIFLQQTLSHDAKEFNETPKTDDSIRSIALSDETIDLLKEQMKRIEKDKARKNPQYVDNDLVICTRNGKPVSPSQINEFWHRDSDKLKLPRIRYHDSRHTHATLMLIANVHPKIVSERLGHSDIQTTLNTYTHVLPHMQSNAVKQFDKIFSNESV